MNSEIWVLNQVIKHQRLHVSGVSQVAGQKKVGQIEKETEVLNDRKLQITSTKLQPKLIDSNKRSTAIARLALAGINPAPTHLVVNRA